MGMTSTDCSCTECRTKFTGWEKYCIVCSIDDRLTALEAKADHVPDDKEMVECPMEWDERHQEYAYYKLGVKWLKYDPKDKYYSFTISNAFTSEEFDEIYDVKQRMEAWIKWEKQAEYGINELKRDTNKVLENT